MSQPVKLSVILPAYNEGRHIYGNLLRANRAIAAIEPQYELVVVDDGSVDNTFSEATRAAAELNRVRVFQCNANLGKGGALQLGVANARASDFIAFLDSDLDIPPEVLAGCFDVMEASGADIVIGSKLHKDSQVEYPLQRRIISYGYYVVLRILFRLKVNDTQTGIKLFKADSIRSIMPRILVKRFAFDIEILAIANNEKYKIAQAPVTVVFQRGSPWGRIKPRDVFKVAQDTAAVFYRLYILKYYDKQKENL